MSLPDRTPKEIRDNVSDDAPVRGDVAHLSQSDNESTGVLVEEISRLQNAANNHNVSLPYNIGDYVLQNNRLFISKNTHTAQAFSTTNFRIVNEAALFSNASLSEDLEDTEFVGFDIEFPNDVPLAFQARHISRAQSAINDFQISRAYRIGDLVLNDDIEYRCVVEVENSTDPFDGDDWVVSDGLGVKNTKHIYTEADFPPAETINSLSRHPLENNTEYIISQPLTVETGLFIDAGFKVLMRSFSTEANVLTFDTSGTDILFTTLNFDGSFTGVAVADTGEIQLTGMVTTNLQAGRHININQTVVSFTDYSQLAAEIVTVDSGTELTVKSSVTFSTTEAGDWDNKARLLELERATFDNISTGTASFIDTTFTRFKTSEFFMFHCEAENFDNFGGVTNCNIAIYALNEFENINDKVKLTSCESVLIDSNNWRGTQGAAEQLIQIDDAIGESIANINNNNLFTTGTDTNAISINSLTDTSRVIVTNNADLNPDAGSLFSNLDETDKRLIVKSNTRQKDSKTFADTKIVTDPGVGNFFELPVISMNTATFYNDDAAVWSSSVNQRMTVIDTVVGKVRYDGLDDSFLNINYVSSLRTGGAGENVFLVILKKKAYTLAGETVALIGVISGASNGAATAAVDSDTGIITGLALSAGGSGYDVSGEDVTLTGNTSGAVLGRATVTIDAFGEITAVVLADGTGMEEIPESRIYNTVSGASDFGNIAGHIIVPVSTGDTFAQAFGNLASVSDAAASTVSTTYTEV